MVLQRSFDSADLKRLLLDSEMIVDRTLVTARERGPGDPAKITRPPLPRGSQVFEAVLDEFQPERTGPNIRVTGPAEASGCHHHHRHHTDRNHLSPYMGRSRSNSRSDPHILSRPSSAKGKSPSRPGSDKGKSPSRPGSSMGKSSLHPDSDRGKSP